MVKKNMGLRKSMASMLNIKFHNFFLMETKETSCMSQLLQSTPKPTLNQH